MSPQITIGEASINDALEITDFAKSVISELECYSAERRAELTSQKDPLAVSKILSLRGAYILVARDSDGQMQGCVGSVPINSAYSRSNLRSASGLWGKWIFVAPTVQNTGLAKTMMRNIFDHAKDIDCDVFEAIVHPKNHPSLKMCESIGLKKVHPMLIDGEFQLLHRKKLRNFEKPEPDVLFF